MKIDPLGQNGGCERRDTKSVLMLVQSVGSIEVLLIKGTQEQFTEAIILYI